MKKIISSLSIICLMLATSVLTIGCSNKENEHPSQYVGKYFFDIVSIKRSGVSADVDMEGAVYDAFTNEGYILLNKDGSVETNLFENVANYYEPKLGYKATFTYNYSWRVRNGKLYLYGSHEYLDQNGNFPYDLNKLTAFMTYVSYYTLFEDSIFASGSVDSYTWTIKFTKQN